MPPRLHFTKFLIVSLALHALVIAAVVFFFKPSLTEIPVFTPVRIVNLPPQETRQLPPLQRPALLHPFPNASFRKNRFRPTPCRRRRNSAKVTRSSCPKTLPRTGVPEGAEQGKAAGKATTPLSQKRTGPLPFLTQNDIDELAGEGMPEKCGDDWVTLIRTIQVHVLQSLAQNQGRKRSQYPDLAAISGYQGSLFIKFDILKDGTLGGVEVLESSGYKILDDEAVRAIRAAAPFQPLPDDSGMQRYSIRAAVIFYLDRGYIR